MQALIGILQGATFTNLPELRSGEEFYWHDLAQQFIALARPSPHDDQVLRQHGWQAATIEQVKLRTFSPLSALQRLWPDLQSANPEHYSDKLNESACKQLIAAQPDDQRAPTARWLKARCQALGEYDLVAVISDYMREANLVADHPWATSVQRPAQFLLSTDRNHAFMLTGTERTGYTLHTFVKGESAPRERFAETVQELMAPCSEWSAADWNSYAPLLQAAPASHDDFWEHPALTNFTGIRHHLVDALSSYSNAQWVEHVREKGAGGLLGTQHVALQRRFMSAPPASWLDHMADDLGLALDNQPAYRLLTDAWMALRTSDSECRDFILPAIREAHPELLGGQSDDELLALWRSSFQAITDNIRQKATQPGERKLIRTTHGFSDMSPESMREVLVGHYGAQVIKALEDAGKLNLLSRAEELPSLVQARSSAQLSSIAGVTTSDSRIYLIGNRTTVQSLPGLFLHEVGEHAGLAQMLGPDYGRMSAHFNRLLREKDTYATWAAMRVPADTDPMHVPSEQLAYLVERVANDAKARPGGERGYELGQECLANLRTWLFRTPLCRWLDEIGALDSFTLRPQDMAAMAREAVDFFAEQVQPGTVTRNRNDWLKELSHEQLDALYQADPHERIKTLERDTPERTLGYLYALAMTNAPLIETAIEHFTPTLSALTAGQGKPELRAIAAELLSLGRKISVQDQLMAQYRRCGFAMWVDGADTPEEATLSYLVPSSKVPGSVQVIYYRKGVGAYGDEPFLTPEHAVSEARTSSFVVSDEEAPAVLQSWASVKETDEQLASKSFSRWFGSSQAVNDNGEPLRMYHGTGQDIAEFRGTTIWASTSPSLANDYAEYRGEWQPGAHANVMPVYLKAERPFDADKLEKTVTLTSFFNEAAEQCVAAGRSFDGEQATVMLNHLRACSRREESGPYYRNYDIWNDARSLFGRDGEQTVQSLFSLFGYDSIRITEQEQLTFGVFAPTQVKSAIGNRGTYNPTVSDIRLANAIESERAAALQQWAGDSKVVDDDGHLLVVYHGSVVRESERAPGMGDIEAFDRLFTLQFRRPSIDTMGSWFSTNPGDGGAQMYSGTREGSVIYPVFLAINNPHETTFELMARRARLLANGVDDGRMVGEAEVNAYRKWLKEMGKDGIKIVHDAGREHQSTEFKNQTVWVALEPTQIKSAIGNVGTFNPLVSDIRLAAYESSDPAAALRHWSGDNKVVDNHGNPLVVFHGTGSGDLTEFSDAKIGSGADSDKGENTAAFWFTSSTSVSDYFAALTHEPAVMPVFIKMENPLVVDCKEWARRFDTLDEGFLFSSNQIVYDIRWFKHHAIAQAKQDGHDGVIFNGGYDGRPDKSATIYAVFDPTHIKSAIGNAGTFDPSIPDIRFSFAGERANTANREQLARAVEMQSSGEAAELVRQVTGWHQGLDGKWRFEVDDSHAQLRGFDNVSSPTDLPAQWIADASSENGVALSQVIDHPELFHAYPFLTTVHLKVDPRRWEGGYATWKDGDQRWQIVVGDPRQYMGGPAEALLVVLHEIQHVIQDVEGFATGGGIDLPGLPTGAQIAEKINAEFRQREEEIKSSERYAELLKSAIAKLPDSAWISSRNGERNELLAYREAEWLIREDAGLVALENERLERIEKVLAHFDFRGAQSPFAGYRHLAGEAEARNTAIRREMSAEQRRAMSPLATLDINPADAIVLAPETTDATQSQRYSFAGERAITADLDLLSQAQSRLAAGDNAEKIRQETGWFLGHDQRWRFEIDDSAVTIPDDWYEYGQAEGQPVYKMHSFLGEHSVALHPAAAAQLGRTHAIATGLIDHPALFNAYPELRQIDVVLERSDGFPFTYNGEFRRARVAGQPDSILLRFNPSRGGSALQGLLHEVQHAIQKAEGFARGGSPNDFRADDLVSNELSGINERINAVMAQHPETATVYRAYNQLRIRANAEKWPDYVMASVAAVEAELIEMPGGADLFDLETERMGVAFIDKVAAPLEQYRRLAGEVEARNVEARLALNAEQRRATPPLSTEDIAPELITVRANTADVLRQALVQEEAEALGAMASSLDMSESARLARAQALGFDTSKVWYHGTEKAGFRVFNTDGIPNSKTSGTGAFFAASESMAKGYSGTYDDAPIYSGAELFADPSLLNDLDIERFWAVITPGGRVDMTCPRIRYDSPEEWIQAEEIELDEGEELQERFTLSYGSSIYEELITQAEAIEELDGLIAAEPGIYSVYLRVKDVLEIDWQGRNWDEGPTEKVWRLHDSDGDVIDYLYNQEDAIEARAANPGSWFEVDEESIYGSTDGAARQARDMGCDAVLIRNVQDTGRHSQHEEGDIMVVFDPSNIRSVNAAFDPAFSASGDLMFSVAEAPQSSAFDNWFEGSQVVNEDGSPLVVYRGEHGRSSDALFQSRLGSLSFGDYETASLYATQPNNRADIPANPRIIPAYLAIKRPLLVDAGDPFIDFSLLIEAIGFERSAVIATELGPYIENTQAWADLDSQLTVGEYLANHPESLGSLYVELYPILDNPKYVDWLKSAGFDGAIYGGSGANSGKAEYRVFDPDQVASGAPMPVEQSAPGHSTRMALCSMPDAPICFSGSPLTGQQFTLEHHHIGLPGEYGYGIYLTKAPVSSTRANRLDGELLTPAALKRLQADHALAPGLRQFLWANGKAIVAGEDVQHLLQARMQQLQNKLAGLEEDLSALSRGNTRPLRAEQYAGMERVVKLELGTLINALARFEHTQSELAEHSYLSWELTLPEQPAEVRSALAILGFDSYSEVRSEAGLRSFYNSVEAQAHLSRLDAEGKEATWITAFPADYHALPRGADVYRELCEILGSASVASARLRETGIQGIQYAQSSAGQTKHRFVLFEPAPRNLPTTKLPALTEQSGHHTPSFPMAISAVPGIALEGGMQAGAPALKRAARAQLKAAEARVAGLQTRQDWLKDLPNASGQVIAQNQAALTRARHELQVLRNWRAPSADNCVPWKAPLSATACRKLSGLINIRTDEQLTGEAVFHLLAERQGSNNAAVEALKKAGFVGADAGNKLLLWDESSKVLARELAQNHERCRYHLVAHGSKHAIDKFSSEKIGTGEGVQAFGYGLYFADRKMVAVHYQKQKVREGCWYEHTFYDHASAMVEAVANRLSAEGASSELVSAAKHCLSIATWAPQRVDQIIEGYPADLQQHLNRVVNGYSKISTDQVSNFFLMPKEGVRSLNEIMAHDDRDYSFGLSYLASGLHYHAREELSDDQLAKLLRDHIERQCDVGEAMEARHYVLRELEQSPGDDYLQSRLRDCDYYLMMAQCAQKTVEAFGPFKLERPLGAGNLYLVDLAIKPSEYVRFDLPYSQQPAMVQQAFSTLVSHDQLTPSKQEALSRAIEGNLSGHELYAATAGRGYYFDAACAEDEVLASTLLLEQGVQGIQYPDGLSRNSEGGTFNYVVFNDERVEILGHTDKHLRSEDEEIPLYEWVDPTFVPAPAHRIG